MSLVWGINGFAIGVVLMFITSMFWPFRRLMEIKEEQLHLEVMRMVRDDDRNTLLRNIFKVLKGGKDGKRKRKK